MEVGDMKISLKVICFFILCFFAICSNLFSQDVFPTWKDYRFAPKPFTHFVKPHSIYPLSSNDTDTSGFRLNPQIDRDIKKSVEQHPDSSWFYIIGTGITDTSKFYLIPEYSNLQGFVEDTSDATTNVNITIRLYAGTNNLQESRYVPSPFGTGNRNYVLIDSVNITSEGSFFWEPANLPKGGWVYYTTNGNGTNNDSRVWFKQVNYSEHIQGK